MTSLFDFAVTTIFARECLEGSIIIGEYRTIVLRGDEHNSLVPGFSQKEALREITISAIVATALALLVIAATATPLAFLSSTFDASTAYIIEGISKIVAAISLLQLSLKMPKMLGIYGSCKNKQTISDEAEASTGLTRRSIRFNVAWNIWREVAECGVFLIPFFLNGEDLEKIPLSAVIGSVVGLLCGFLIYYANRKLTKKIRLCIFAVMLLVILSAGLFTGGAHKLEVELGTTKKVWRIGSRFWAVERLPMTILKPFGYNDSRTVLEIVCYWSWLVLAGLLHYRKYRRAPKIRTIEKAGSSNAATSQEVIDQDEESTFMGDTTGENTVCPNQQTGVDRSMRTSTESLEDGRNVKTKPRPTYLIQPEDAC